MVVPNKDQDLGKEEADDIMDSVNDTATANDPDAQLKEEMVQTEAASDATAAKTTADQEQVVSGAENDAVGAGADAVKIGGGGI